MRVKGSSPPSDTRLTQARLSQVSKTPKTKDVPEVVGSPKKVRIQSLRPHVSVGELAERRALLDVPVLALERTDGVHKVVSVGTRRRCDFSFAFESLDSETIFLSRRPGAVLVTKNECGVGRLGSYQRPGDGRVSLTAGVVHWLGVNGGGWLAMTCMDDGVLVRAVINGS